MPSDLFSLQSNEDFLVASPESQTPKLEGSDSSSAIGDEEANVSFTIQKEYLGAQELGDSRAKANESINLHPYAQTLSLSNLECCVALENAVFPKHERCSREKFIYRLTTCPELCLGLFSTASSTSSNSSAPTYALAHPPNSASPDLKSVLIAMIIATKTITPHVTDHSMEVPANWQSNLSSSDVRGHLEDGRTVAIHTLGVLPAYQGRGLGNIIVKSYQQRMETSGIADRIVLLAHDHLTKMYEEMGFENKGKSSVKFAGGGWNNMIYEFPKNGLGS